MIRLRLAVTSLATLALAGCVIDHPPFVPDSGQPIFIDPPAATTDIYGFSSDPEAYFLSLLGCGPDCPAPPLIFENVPHYERARVGGSSIALLDSADGQAAATVTGDERGDWLIPAFPSTNESLYLISGTGGTLAPEFDFGLGLFPLPPPGDYLPTMTLRPVVPNYSKCYFQETALMSEEGMLSAVAKHLTAGGTATTTADLLDPSKFGGVAVFWSYLPADNPAVRVPAFDTGHTSDVGTMLPISWAPPGDLPPEVQSSRGFFVDTSAAPVSTFGVSVLVLPPVTEPPTFVTIGTVDPAELVSNGEMQLPLVPGIIGFAALNLFELPPPGTPPPEGPPSGPPPYSWLCLP